MSRMTWHASLFVPGIPKPKGSMKAFMPKGGRFPVVTHDNPASTEFAKLVTLAAHEHAPESGPIQGPCSLQMIFVLPRPKSLPKRVTCHTKKPDIDKLCRNAIDALTQAGWWQDDALLISVGALKRYPGDDYPHCGVAIEAWEVFA